MEEEKCECRAWCQHTIRKGKNVVMSKVVDLNTNSRIEPTWPLDRMWTDDETFGASWASPFHCIAGFQPSSSSVFQRSTSHYLNPVVGECSICFPKHITSCLNGALVPTLPFCRSELQSHMWWMSCVEKGTEEGHYVSAAPIQNKVIWASLTDLQFPYSFRDLQSCCCCCWQLMVLRAWNVF